MVRGTRAAAFWLVCALAMPCMASSPGAQAPAAPPRAAVTPAAPAQELLGDGDSVRVTVFQNPDLTTEARISERGAISVPLIGEVVIAGLTPEGAAARIADRLTRGKFVVNPQVSLTIQQVRSRQVSVL